MAGEDEREYDRCCNKWFDDSKAYHRHKCVSPHHNTCRVCSEDFASDTARIRHQTQMHGASQNLNCTNCGEHFTRLGSLVAHFEGDDRCMYKDVHVARRDPENKVQIKTRTPDVEWLMADHSLEFQDPPPATVIPWGVPELDTRVSVDKNNNFPKLGNAEYRDGFSKVEDFLTGGPLLLDSQLENKWIGVEEKSKSDELFPNAAPNLPQPNAENIIMQAKKARKKSDTEHPFHPDNPAFDEKFRKTLYNNFAKKWNCPHSYCKRPFKEWAHLRAHLKGDAHYGVSLRCPRCMNTFINMVALTQHIESQASACYIREAPNADDAVQELTAGLAIVDGRHSDTTIKYAVGSNISGPAALKAMEERYKIGGLEDQERAEQESVVDTEVEW